MKQFGDIAAIIDHLLSQRMKKRQAFGELAPLRK